MGRTRLTLPIYKLGAFAERLFTGGPTVVCVLDDAMEVDLAGHPTLAAAWVVFERCGETGDSLVFEGSLGPLPVERDGDLLLMDFPAVPACPEPAPAEIVEAVGPDPVACFRMDPIHRIEYRMLVYSDEARLRALAPDYRLIKERQVNILATAPGDAVEFVSLTFCPAVGEDEDPVTGSAHCTSAPYWADRLGRDRLIARQLSSREPEIRCEPRGDRVILSGRCVPYLKGRIEISLPAS